MILPPFPNAPGRSLKKIYEEADRDDAVAFSNFNADKFYEASMKVYKEVLRTATPEEQKDPAFLESATG